MGRHSIDDEVRKTTMFFAMKISEGSGLSASELERQLKMESVPPGKNWRRYLRGERTISADLRDRITRKAITKGWISKTREFDYKSDRAYGWVQQGKSLAETRDDISKMKSGISLGRTNAIAAREAVGKLVAFMNEAETKYNVWMSCHHKSFIYEDFDENGPKMELDQYVQVFSALHLRDQLVEITEKLQCLNFFSNVEFDPDFQA